MDAIFTGKKKKKKPVEIEFGWEDMRNKLIVNFIMVGSISRVWELTFLFNVFHINSDIEPTSKKDLRQLLINHTNPTKLWNQKYTKQRISKSWNPICG